MRLVFLKLGGSLITVKDMPYTVRVEKLDALSAEVAEGLQENTDLKLVLGHGSGSFGHVAASLHATRQGVSTPDAWRGFAEVWFQASALNRLVVEALHRVNLPVMGFSPAASVIAQDGKVDAWDTTPIMSALANNLLPVIQGDVVFDRIRGGTILSTEDLFAHLAQQLHPQQILLAGLEDGVWADFPARTHLLSQITPTDKAVLTPGLGAAVGIDVTGGMHSKVTGMLALLGAIPQLEILIFSGEQPGNLRRALRGENPGTRLHR